MKHLHSLALALALCGLAATGAAAQGVTIGGWGDPPPRRHGGGLHHGGQGGFHGGFHALPVFVIERQPPVVIEREIIREVPVLVEAAPPPPPPPRKPYKIGASYAALPAGCMKLLEGGAAYYLCSGEWYRQVGSGYRAVAKP